MITWPIETTTISEFRNTVSVKAVRTDSEDPQNPQTFTLAKADKRNPVAIADEIWNKHQSAIKKRDDDIAFKDDLALKVQASLEARE